MKKMLILTSPKNSNVRLTRKNIRPQFSDIIRLISLRGKFYEKTFPFFRGLDLEKEVLTYGCRGGNEFCYIEKRFMMQRMQIWGDIFLRGERPWKVSARRSNLALSRWRVDLQGTDLQRNNAAADGRLAWRPDASRHTALRRRRHHEMWAFPVRKSQRSHA